MTETTCENCGAQATGSINGRGFCNKPGCIDKVIAGAVKPIRQTMRDILTREDAPHAK